MRKLHLQRVILSVMKCVNKMRAKELKRREFRYNCEMLD